MALNINGYNLSSNSTGMVFGSSNTVVDTSGRLIMPTKPAFFGSKTGTGSQNRQYPWAINSTQVNIGTAWSTSAFVFTCPVAGLYFTSWGGICGGVLNTATSGYVGLIKNGGLQYYTHWNTRDSYWDTQNLQMVLSCAAGDTISWAVNITPAPDSSSGYGAYGDNHNMSTIWLIG